MKTVKKVLFFLVALNGFIFSMSASEPVISDVVARQRWPWSRLVDINYMLTCDSTQRMDISIQAVDGIDSLTLPLASLEGDLYSVSCGPHHIVWDPTCTTYTNNQALTQFRVTLTPTAVPVYVIVDLTKSVGAEGQIEYIYPGDERLQTVGRWTNVWFAVTNDAAYVNDKLVLRRIPAGVYKTGTYPPTKDITFTRDFYAGVFALTRAQWNRIMEDTTGSVYPQGRTSYDEIRGSTNDVPVVDWPSTGTYVSPTAFLGRLRDQTGLPGLDLPTCAQWECLCRAGTTSYYNDGESTSSADTNILNRIAWWNGNATTLYPVGQKEANPWGLYDTIGNTFEWCRDWSGTATGTTDPAGPQSGTKRVCMSYNRAGGAAYYVPSYRLEYEPTFKAVESFSFRVVWVLP